MNRLQRLYQVLDKNHLIDIGLILLIGLLTAIYKLDKAGLL